MKTFVLGASGATGIHVVDHLLKNRHEVKVVIRNAANIPERWIKNPSITLIRANVAEIKTNDMADYLSDCDSAVSCLGHTLSLKGMYGKPRQLVTDATKGVFDAIKKLNPNKPFKFVLMNTAGNRNKEAAEPISIKEQIAVGLIRLLLPPHVDNEKAADFLSTNIGQNNPLFEWVVVRPDTLLNEEEVTRYKVLESPSRSAIFNAGKTSRINVGHFMAELVSENSLWDKWKGKMPVIYNEERTA